MEDLKELIARVEGAKIPEGERRFAIDARSPEWIALRELEAAIVGAIDPTPRECWCTGACDPTNRAWAGACVTVDRVTTSLDAALSLLERVLPEAYAGVQQNRYEPGEAGDRTWNGYVFLNDEEHESLKHPTPALALVLAILEALSTENDDGR